MVIYGIDNIRNSFVNNEDDEKEKLKQDRIPIIVRFGIKIADSALWDVGYPIKVWIEKDDKVDDIFYNV